jgi:hypothetical protein
MTTSLFNLIKEKHNELIEKAKGCSSFYEIIRLPIKKIDGVKISGFEIDIYLKRIKLEIHGNFTNTECDVLWSYTICNNDDGDMDLKINEFIEEITKNVPLLKLGCTGYFHTPTDLEKIKKHKEIANCFKCENVELEYDTCGVCYEETSTKTDCGHSLCHRCWGKIEKVNCDCDEWVLPCPICRKDIYNL